MKVYLAGPIANMDDVKAKNWRDIATLLLHQDGFEVLNPMTMRDFRGVDAVSSMVVVEPDKADIDASQIILANAHVPSVGTSMEILYAWERAKYVVTVVPDRDRCSPWIMYHSHVVVTTLGDALSAIASYKDVPFQPIPAASRERDEIMRMMGLFPEDKSNVTDFMRHYMYDPWFHTLVNLIRFGQFANLPGDRKPAPGDKMADEVLRSRP